LIRSLPDGIGHDEWVSYAEQDNVATTARLTSAGSSTLIQSSLMMTAQDNTAVTKTSITEQEGAIISDLHLIYT
jgi:hypothetical protein